MFSVLGAISLSVSAAMLTSLIDVAWLGWHWHVLAVLWMLITALALAAVIARPPTFETVDFDYADGIGDIIPPGDRWDVAAPRWRADPLAVDDVDVWNDQRLWLLTLSGLLISGLAIALSDPGDIDGYGLISAVPPWFFAGVALIVAALFAQLSRGGRNGHIAAAVNLGILIFVLHGLPGFVEPKTRFPVVWLHAGFADQIAYEGRLLPRLDARFSWAGFFSGRPSSSVSPAPTISSGSCGSRRSP